MSYVGTENIFCSMCYTNGCYSNIHEKFFFTLCNIVYSKSVIHTRNLSEIIAFQTDDNLFTKENYSLLVY